MATPYAYTYEVDQEAEDAFISRDGEEVFTISRATWRGPNTTLWEAHRHGLERPTAIINAPSIGNATRQFRMNLELGTPLKPLEGAA